MQQFSTYADNQESIEVEAFLGERKLAKDNLLLAKARLSGFAKKPRGEIQIEVAFELSTELELKITAKELTTDKSVVAVGCPPEPLTQDKIKHLLIEADLARSIDDKAIKEIETRNRADGLIYRAERYLAKNPDSFARKEIEKLVAELGNALESFIVDNVSLHCDTLDSRLTKAVADPFEIFRTAFAHYSPASTKAPVAQPKPSRAQNSGKYSKAEITSTAPSSGSALGKVFGGLTVNPDPNFCFVLMPFADDFRPLYDDHIKKVVRERSMECVRADEMVGVGSITKDIWDGICRARFLIADLSGRNANVFYEVGLAHALGKDVILLTRKMEDVPFDLKNLRCIEYEFTPRGVRELEARLGRLIDDLFRAS